MTQEAMERIPGRLNIYRRLLRLAGDAGSSTVRCPVPKGLFPALAAALMVFLAVATGALAATTQQITLHPGWNAVYLEVQPESKTPAAVFRDLPVESVWTWFDRGSSVEFIRDPSEGLWAQPGWSVYAKAADKATVNNLFAIFANRAYLIKLGGAQHVTWTVTGTPATDKTVWTPNSFNLVGFHVNPARLPNLADYLSVSSALKGQQVYRLSAQGAWEPVANPATTPIRSGEAYWVYCSGASTFQGPLSVQTAGNELDYGTSTVMSSVTITNDAAVPRTATVRFQPAADWFTYRSFNSASGLYDYLKLEALTLPLAAGRQTNLWLAVRRELLANGVSQGTLEITDDAGSRFMIPVRAEKLAQ